ncbi:exomer complex subunit [Hanseniaspora uvarum]|nr:exomer complex subunit [Hanseniaspora uvarum]
MLLNQSTIPEVTDDFLSQALFERQKSLRLWSNHLQEIPVEVKSPKDGEYLGPPDLVQVYKYLQDPSDTKTESNYLPKNSPLDFLFDLKKKEQMTTHFYTIGIDNSDPNSIVSYLKQIKDAIENGNESELSDVKEGQLWFGSVKKFKVGWIEYVTYDPFKFVDIHVKMYFSGQTSIYYSDMHCDFVDDLKFGKFDISPESKYYTINEEFWINCYMGSIIRLIAHLNGNQFGSENNSIVECKILNPLANDAINNTAEMFILNFKNIFNHGHLTGSPEVRITTTILNNYAIVSFLKIVELSDSYELAFKVVDGIILGCKKGLLKLKLNYLNIKLMYINGRITDALAAIINDINKINDLSKQDKEYCIDYYSELIEMQIEILLELIRTSKDAQLPSLEELKKLAIHFAEIQPQEIQPWILLSKVLIMDGNIDEALVALNNAPLENLKDPFVLLRTGFKSVVESQNIHLPLPTDVVISEITGLSSEEVYGEKDQIDPILRDLPGNNLKTGYSKCYNLLVEMISKVTWDTLLDIRSKIFIMDEEYGPLTVSMEAEETENKQKRICSRWLDSMFMILYKDLKYFNKWQIELMKLTNGEELGQEPDKAIFKGSCFEYELLGNLSLRLNKKAESKFAYQQALSIRFSNIASKNMVPILFEERNELIKKAYSNTLSSETVSKMVDVIDNQIITHLINISVWRHRWYMEFSIFVISSFKKILNLYGGYDKMDIMYAEMREQYNEQVADMVKEQILHHSV